MLKVVLNSEKMAAERRMSNENYGNEQAAARQNMIMDDDFGHEAAENQLAAISTANY